MTRLEVKTPAQVKPLPEYAHDFLVSVPGLSYRLEPITDNENEYHLVIFAKMSDVTHLDETIDDYPDIWVGLSNGVTIRIEGSAHASLAVQVSGVWREFDSNNYELGLVSMSVRNGELGITLYARELRREFRAKVMSSDLAGTEYHIHVSNDYDRYDVAVRLIGHTWVVEVNGMNYARGKTLEEALESAINKWNFEHGGIPNPFTAVRNALMREGA